MQASPPGGKITSIRSVLYRRNGFFGDKLSYRICGMVCGGTKWIDFKP
nr:hypothetical protein P5630_06420 [Bacillus subtilis]